jgi:rhodanese-related sulfurtransferase
MRKTQRVLKIVIAGFVLTLGFAALSLAGPDLKTIDTAQLHSMVAENTYELEAGRQVHFVIIDARTREEYGASHIFSAINVPEKDFGQSMSALPKDKGALLVVYDNDAKLETAGKCAKKAAASGYANIVLYAEGFPAWKKTAKPVVSIKN